MAEPMASATYASGVPRQSRGSATEASGWVGWIVFAGMMMVIVGILHAIQGLVALFNDEYYLVGKSGLVVTLDYTAWGWVHLLAGIVVAAAGVALFAGKMWARVVGVGVAAASLVMNFAFIAAYPFWSAILIAMNVFVILALVVHGREMQEL